MRQHLDHLCAPETLRPIQATEPRLLLDMPRGQGLGLQSSDRVTGYELPLKACSRVASTVMNCIPRRSMHQRQRCHKSGLKLLSDGAQSSPDSLLCTTRGFTNPRRRQRRSQGLVTRMKYIMVYAMVYCGTLWHILVDYMEYYSLQSIVINIRA